MFKSRTMLWTLVASLALILFTSASADAFWHGRCWGCGYGGYSVGYWGGWGGWGGGCGGGYRTGYWAPAYSGCSSCAGGACYSSSYWGYPAYYQSYYPTYSSDYSPAYASPPVYGGCSSCLGSTTTATSYASVASTARPAAPASVAAAAPVATGRIVFSVAVPSDAKVYINDRSTTSTGTLRSYAAGGVTPGYMYGFTVRCERVVDGRLVSETQTVRLTPGQTSQLAFNLTPATTAVAAQEVRPLVKLAAAR
jgi:uncharacterized protein (TIGR03000 family)